MVVICGEQTQGRGTKGRRWHSPGKKGLYASVVLRPAREDVSLFPLVAGIAAAEALFEITGLDVRLKWPNDLIASGKKLGGILCESGCCSGRLDFVILGIGLNLSHSRTDFPEDLRGRATSLRLMGCRKVNENALLGCLWSRLGCWYRRFLGREDGEILARFQELMIIPIGKKINVETGDGRLTGTYRGLNEEGGLILESGGRAQSFYSAEVSVIE
jgi:BirA family biotin operon repressor/biotin-[acetyl-CoA-carboxylase] ligase